MDIKDKDLEMDPDPLSEWFEKLSLSPEPIPDLSGTIDYLDGEPENINLVTGINGNSAEECNFSENKCNLNNSTENYFQRNIKSENEENINISEKVTVKKEIVPSVFIKKEIQEEENDIIKSEAETDSFSSDDESCTDLIARGGPERLRTQKRSHKAKSRQPRARVSHEGIDEQKLLHGNSGFIVYENYTASNYNAAESDLLIYSPSNQQPNSPESGYDSSQSSAHSPSQPVVDSSTVHFLPEDHDEAIKKIVKSLLEVEKHVKSQQNTINQSSSCDDTELIASQKYEPLNLVKKNIALNLQNRYDLFNCFDDNLIGSGNFLAECVDEDFDLSIFINEQSNLTINRNTSGTIGSMFENTESATIPLLCSTTPAKQEEHCKRKICTTIGESAKKALRYSDAFDGEKYRAEALKMLRKIKDQSKTNEGVKIIEIDGREKFQSLRQTNLHSAVIESNIEKVLCIIEAMKRFRLADLNREINNRDDNKKTALDYAVEQKMPLLINYLRENTAVQSVEC